MSVSPLSLFAIIAGTVLLSTALSVGIVALMLPGKQTGTTDTALAQVEQLPLLSATQALQSFQCLKAERKVIISSGIEDAYAPGGELRRPSNALVDYFAQRIGPKGAVETTRDYDEAGYDSFFIETLAIPKETVSGLFVLRTRPLTTTTNDTLAIGDLTTFYSHDNNATFLLAEIDANQIWSKTGDILTASLSELDFPNRRQFEDGRMYPQTHGSLLDFIGAAETSNQNVSILIGDDHIVDFIGVAVCLPPEQNLGLTFQVRASAVSVDHVQMSCFDEEKVAQCNVHAGDAPCDQALPIACMKDIQEQPFDLFETEFEDKWTGSEVSFSRPVEGLAFSSASEVHHFCKRTFGDGYRAATNEEVKSLHNYYARGRAPEGGRAWVHSKTQPYANCWALNANTGAPQ